MDFSIGGKSLMDYWAVLVHRRWVIALIVITFTVVALVNSVTSSPRYRATATIHIERQNPDIFAFDGLSKAEHSWTAYSDFYQTQYKILSSPAIARRAAERLAWDSRPEMTDPQKPGLMARLRSLIPSSTPKAERDPLDVATSEILGSLEILPERNSQLVNISWISGEPETAVEVANALANAYIAYNIESTFATTDQAQEFLVDQIAHLRTEIVEIESELQQYGEAKRILSIDDSNNIQLSAVKETAQRRNVVQARLAEAEANWRAVQESAPDALTEVLESDLIARLRQEYAGYEAEYTEKSRRFKADWPGMQVLKSRLDGASERLDLELTRIAEQVRATAKTEYDRALEEVAALERLLGEQEEAAQLLKRDGFEFASLAGEVATKRQTLDGLLQRQTEMALSSQLKDLDTTSTNIRIVEPARTPTAPFSPNPKRAMLMALILSLCCGVGVALLLDYLDNTINSAQQLSDLIPLPLLAVIPRHQTVEDKSDATKISAAPKFDIVSHSDPRSVVAEAYRDLRTSILLSNPGEPPRRLMVTSALPEEGKTSTAINLSIVLAQLGRRVILIDTDLRRPRLHKALGKSNRAGVSTFLSGLENDAAGLVVGSGIDNLDLMLSGPIPPNPSELLDSPRFRQLADDLLESGYDHVVFDSPPSLSVSDPVIIANMVDVGVLVVRAGKTARQSVRLAAAKFQHSSNEKIGIVLNDLDADRHGAAHYRYQYYGRYGEESAEGTESDGGRAAEASGS